MRLSERFYRILVSLYPAGFREAYGGPLRRQFKDEVSEATDPASLFRLWGRTLADLARSVPSQIAREAWQDTRHALRLWRLRPLHTGFALAVLTVAIGVNTGIFSVLNALLLRSLPFHQPERLAAMRMLLPAGMGAQREFHEWHRASAYAADAFSYTSNEVNLEGASQAARSRLTETSSNFFDVLGVAPAIGRGFAPGEDEPGAEALAVIGHGLWQELYGGAESAIGATIRVNGVPLTIVGVAPPGFDYPRGTSVWSSTVFDYRRIGKSGVTMYSAVLRIADGVTWPQARQAFELEAYAAAPQRRASDPANRPALVSLRDELAGPVRQASLVLMAGAALLLLLACANVANFLLSRILAREQELMIRAALGASRARLTQQLLTESLLLSGIAAVAGLAVAWASVEAAAALQPSPLASQGFSLLDWQVLAFTVFLSLSTGLVFGVGPAAYVLRRTFAVSTRTASRGRHQSRATNALIVVQVAVTIVLLTASAALGRTFIGLLRVDNGYALGSVATMSVSFAGTPYADSQSLQYYEQALARLRGVPGVESVSATQFLPLAIDAYSGNRFTVDAAGEATLATTVPIAPDYFATLGAPVLAGRELTAADMAGGAAGSVAIVNDKFAESFGGSRAIVGRLLTPVRGEPSRIVGVVGGMRDSGPLHAPPPQVFFPARTPRALTFVIRVTGAAEPSLAVLRDALTAVDPRVPVYDAKTMAQRLDDTLARPQLYATAVAFFGGVALLLSIIGVYGIVASACRERTRELGIRLALGSTPRSLRATLVGHVVILAAAAAALGGGVAGVSGRVLSALIPGADAYLVTTLMFAILAAVVVAAAATWMATRRVVTIDITRALRPEA